VRVHLGAEEISTLEGCVRARFVYAHIFPRRTQAQTGARMRAACARGARAAKSAQRAAAGASGGGNHCSDFLREFFALKKWLPFFRKKKISESMAAARFFFHEHACHRSGTNHIVYFLVEKRSSLALRATSLSFELFFGLAESSFPLSERLRFCSRRARQAVHIGFKIFSFISLAVFLSCTRLIGQLMLLSICVEIPGAA